MQERLRRQAEVISLDDRRCLQWDLDGLDALTGALDQAGRCTEHGFLVLGGKVKLFHDRACDISRMAGDAMQLLHGDDGENTLQHLQLLVERCSLWLSATHAESIEICTLLKTVMQQVTELELPVSGLRKVVKALHSLRVSTRIEAAKGYASGAVVLARSLDHLGGQVHDKVVEIDERTQTLLPMIGQALGMEESTQSGALRVAGDEVQHTRRLLSLFVDNCITTGQWTGRLKECSDDVRQRFGEMIAALQFQDITRQRVEHVQQALADLGRHLEKLTGRSDRSHDQDAARLFGRICRLQHGQLDLACREFVAAADNLSSNLKGMSTSVVAMAEDTRELSRVTEVGDDNRFEAVLEVLKTIAGCLDEARSIHHSSGKLLVEVCAGLQGVTDRVQQVELIGEEMQLVAMNAAISAAHARTRGAGLEIIARNIHGVAEEATGHALALADACASITRHAARLQDIERGVLTSSGDVGSLLEEARGRMVKLEANGVKLRQLAVAVDQSALTLAEDVNHAVRKIDVRREFQAQLAPVLDSLDRLASPHDEVVNASGAVTLDALFSDLEYCYTMDSERRVHRQFVKSHQPLGASAGCDDREGFPAGREHGLGDNVDLF